jgi:hypothetical protein
MQASPELRIGGWQGSAKGGCQRYGVQVGTKEEGYSLHRFATGCELNRIFRIQASSNSTVLKLLECATNHSYNPDFPLIRFNIH